MLTKFTERKLTEREVADLIRDVLAQLIRVPMVEQIILFGSSVSGGMTDASDLDFVLIFPDQGSAKQGAKAIHHVRKIPVISIDTICVDRATYERRSEIGGVFMVAKTEGRVVYSKGSVDGRANQEV